MRKIDKIGKYSGYWESRTEDNNLYADVIEQKLDMLAEKINELIEEHNEQCETSED